MSKSPPLRLMLPALGGALLVAIAIWAGARRLPSSDPTPVDYFPPLALGEQAILFGGDTLLAGGSEVEKHLREDGPDWSSRKLVPLVRSARAVAFVANLEGPITERKAKGPPDGRKWTYRMRPGTIPGLTAVSITHLGVANNHALDRRVEGLYDTFDNLRGAGLVPFGGGRDATEAFEPTVIEAGGARVAVLALMQRYPDLEKAGWRASAGRGGVALLGGDEDEAALVARARADADIVVAFPHWGDNYRPVVGKQRRLAERLVRAGVDAIVGHHGHAAQGFGTVDGTPVIWGLGNFLFGSPGRFGHDKMQPGYGLLARMVVAEGAIRRFELVPIMLNNRLLDYQPRPCTRGEAERVLLDLARAEGYTIRFVSGVGVMDVGGRPARARDEATP